VFSAGAGKGSTFTVTLPLTRDSHVAIEPGDRSRALLTDLNILIVDDEQDVRELLAAMLEAAGARATTATSAKSALDLIATHRFDVLVSDIGLPEQDGMQLLEKVRALGYTMPAIAVTAFAGPDDRRRILESGYQAHLAKPINPVLLVRAIAGLVAAARPSP
jgi:CheY-like chemotaxis protein